MSRKPLVLEDVLDDLRQGGPMLRSYLAATVQTLKAQGVNGDALHMAMDAIDDARRATGTGPYWRLAECVKSNFLKGDQDNA